MDQDSEAVVVPRYPTGPCRPRPPRSLGRPSRRPGQPRLDGDRSRRRWPIRQRIRRCPRCAASGTSGLRRADAATSGTAWRVQRWEGELKPGDSHVRDSGQPGEPAGHSRLEGDFRGRAVSGEGRGVATRPAGHPRQRMRPVAGVQTDCWGRFARRRVSTDRPRDSAPAAPTNLRRDPLQILRHISAPLHLRDERYQSHDAQSWLDVSQSLAAPRCVSGTAATVGYLLTTVGSTRVRPSWSRLSRN